MVVGRLLVSRMLVGLMVVDKIVAEKVQGLWRAHFKKKLNFVEQN